MLMRNITTAIFVILFFNCFWSVSFACNREDPLCVAKTILEQGITYKLNNIKEFYCSDNDAGYQTMLKAKKYMISRYQKNGVDYSKQVQFDLSKIKYKLTYKESGDVIVKAAGNVFVKVEGTGFQKNNNLESIFKLKKEKNRKYCYPKNGLIKD